MCGLALVGTETGVLSPGPRFDPIKTLASLRPNSLKRTRKQHLPPGLSKAKSGVTPGNTCPLRLYGDRWHFPRVLGRLTASVGAG